jgi:hypothetical protein
MVIDAMDTCGNAYGAAAAAIRTVDADAIEAATDLIDDCSTDLDQAVDQMGSGAGGSGDADYDSAYEAWLDIPVGDDLCPEWETGELGDDLIAYVYPDEDPDAVEQVLADHC